MRELNVSTGTWRDYGDHYRIRTDLTGAARGSVGHLVDRSRRARSSRDADDHARARTRRRRRARGGPDGNRRRPTAPSLAVFVAVSLTGIVLIRPLALRRLKRRTTFPTGTAALVGQTGYVLADVSPHAGRIRIGGEEWSARPYDESSVIPAGSAVDVLQIKGATALVHKRE